MYMIHSWISTYGMVAFLFLLSLFIIMHFFFFWKLPERLNLLHSREDRRNMRFVLFWSCQNNWTFFILETIAGILLCSSFGWPVQLNLLYSREDRWNMRFSSFGSCWNNFSRRSLEYAFLLHLGAAGRIESALFSRSSQEYAFLLLLEAARTIDSSSFSRSTLFMHFFFLWELLEQLNLFNSREDHRKMRLLFAFCRHTTVDTVHVLPRL